MLGAEALALRAEIFRAFATTGRPPLKIRLADVLSTRELVEAHVVVLGDEGEVVMAHPFAGHRRGTRVDAGGRTWWGNCAWDGLGIVAALGLGDDAVVTDTATGVVATNDAWFHVAVPAREWWADIGFT